MKVNIISRKLIKPCTPTPQNLNKYKISLSDELTPPMNMNVILFYPPNPKNPFITSHLEESLSKTLPQFYPLAGRYIKKDLLVDCNDEGAELAEAEATDIELMIDLKTTKPSYPLNDLLSRQIYEIDTATDPMLSIQITRFQKCGGLAIGISVSHRIFDASSLATFIEAWSINAATSTIMIGPSFDSPSLFPCRNLGLDFGQPKRIRDSTIVVKSVLFNREDITNLRSKIRPTKSGEEKVLFSRVRVVSALIAKAMIRLDREKHGRTRDCYIMQPVNMRGRTLISRLLTQHSCGNLLIPSVTRCIAANTEIGFEELIYELGDAIHKTIAQMSCLGKDGHKDDAVIFDAAGKRVQETIAKPTVNALVFTDWSKFGFYEADLGWGKPVWAGIGATPLPHATTLMSNKEGDGIEAWVHLNRDDVPCFERCLQMAQMEISEQD